MASGDMEIPESASTIGVFEKEPERCFQCRICLDLAYKPVVRACGHVFCFWCTVHSMDGISLSLCPLCRRPCSHFPRICEMLHFLLMKVMPEEYCRRAQETEEYETAEKMFSPCILPSSRILHNKDGHLLPAKASVPQDNGLTEVSVTASPGSKSLPSSSMSSCRGKEVVSLQQHSHCDDQTCNKLPATEDLSCCPHQCAPQVSSSANAGLECLQPPLTISEKRQEESQLYSFCGDQMCIELSEVDFLCMKCNWFLYNPVVLHCGEVFCQGCVVKSSSDITCPSCSCAHPGGSVDVCLDLKHYLESLFPESVLERKADSARYLAKGTMTETSDSQATEETQAVHLGVKYVATGTMTETSDSQATEETEAVHIGVGCDGCGMHPILGERYYCEDCPERAGYDLCGDCYAKKSDWDGRFNQQHTADHHMKKVSIQPSQLIVLPSYLAVLSAHEGLSHHSEVDDGSNDIDNNR